MIVDMRRMRCDARRFILFIAVLLECSAFAARTDSHEDPQSPQGVVHAVVGQPFLILPCKAINHPAGVDWTLTKQAVKPSTLFYDSRLQNNNQRGYTLRHLSEDDKSLVIKNMTLEDAGQYECNEETGYGPPRCYNVTVADEFVFTKSTNIPRITSVMGNTVKFQCPRSTPSGATWKFKQKGSDEADVIVANGQVRRSGYKLDRFGNLEIHNLKESNTGTYTFVDDEGLGNPHEYQLIVTESAEYYSRNQTAELGSQVIFSCPINDTATPIWTHGVDKTYIFNGKAVAQKFEDRFSVYASASTLMSYLINSNVTSEDFVVYTCLLNSEPKYYLSLSEMRDGSAPEAYQVNDRVAQSESCTASKSENNQKYGFNVALYLKLLRRKLLQMMSQRTQAKFETITSQKQGKELFLKVYNKIWTTATLSKSQTESPPLLRGTLERVDPNFGDNRTSNCDDHVNAMEGDIRDSTQSEKSQTDWRMWSSSFLSTCHVADDKIDHHRNSPRGASPPPSPVHIKRTGEASTDNFGQTVLKRLEPVDTVEGQQKDSGVDSMSKCLEEPEAKSGTETDGVAPPLQQFSSPEQTLIPWSSLRIGEIVGEGGFGDVHKAIHDTLGDVAYKKIKDICAGKKNRYMPNTEISIHCQLKHKNVVRLFGNVSEAGQQGIVMELAIHGDLRKFLSKYQAMKFTVPVALKISLARDVASGMRYLHSRQPRPLIHGDLKAKNVLVASGFIAKLADFGLSTWKRNTQSVCREKTTPGGTVSHIPPERFCDINQQPTVMFDVYAFGILLWELLAHPCRPYNGVDVAIIRTMVLNGERPPIDKIPESVPKTLSDIVVSCWQQAPDKRPTFEGIHEKLVNLATTHNADIEEARTQLCQQAQFGNVLHHDSPDVVISAIQNRTICAH